MGRVSEDQSLPDVLGKLDNKTLGTFHIVQRGSSLSKIAKEVYGDPMK